MNPQQLAMLQMLLGSRPQSDISDDDASRIQDRRGPFMRSLERMLIETSPGPSVGTRGSGDGSAKKSDSPYTRRSPMFSKSGREAEWLRRDMRDPAVAALAQGTPRVPAGYIAPQYRTTNKANTPITRRTKRQGETIQSDPALTQMNEQAWARYIRENPGTVRPSR